MKYNFKKLLVWVFAVVLCVSGSGRNTELAELQELREEGLNETVKVLVDGPSRKNKEMLSGRTSTHKIVLFKGDKELIGKFVNIKINETKTWTLYGEIAE